MPAVDRVAGVSDHLAVKSARNNMAGNGRSGMEAVVAMSLNRVIGVDNELPWHLPEDLKFFKKLTMGHAMLMGRKTYDSIGRPLPGRRSLVLSRTMPATLGVEVLRSPEAVAEVALEAGQALFVIGGEEIFRLFLPQCRRVWLTVVERSIDGDAFLPPFEAKFPAPRLLSAGDGWRREVFERETLTK